MAGIPSGLDPVAHDPTAFGDAIAEVDATLARLHESMDDRLRRARQLATHWHGTAADRFAGDLADRLRGVHQDVVGELEATRRMLLTSLDAIQAENRARARQREAWLRARAQDRSAP